MANTRNQGEGSVDRQVATSSSPSSPEPTSASNSDSEFEGHDDSDWSNEDRPSMVPNADREIEYIRPVAAAYKQREGIATKKVPLYPRPATPSSMKQSTPTSSSSTAPDNDTINALYQKALSLSLALKSLSPQKYHDLLVESMLYRWQGDSSRFTINHIYASDTGVQIYQGVQWHPKHRRR